MKIGQKRVVGKSVLLLAVLCSSCRIPERTPDAGSIHLEMRDASQATRELYRYVWSGREFFDTRSEPRIRALLERLSGDFHRVEGRAHREGQGYLSEPGFLLTLKLHRELIQDAAKRFDEGQKEYAQWRLSGLAESCISCHSRLQAPIDFVAPEPGPVAEGALPPAEALGRAEFLYATRQFDNASNLLWNIVQRGVSQARGGDLITARALRLWLVVEVRNKARFSQSANKLDELLKLAGLPAEEKELLSAWRDDLLRARKEPMSLQKIEALLPSAGEGGSLRRDELFLVRSLRASAALHENLSRGLAPAERKQALFLLASAYYHIPIVTFEPQQELYLEMVIREYPHTYQAERSFQMYQERATELAAGSGGVHLEPEVTQKLAELSELARRVVPAKGQKSA